MQLDSGTTRSNRPVAVGLAVLISFLVSAFAVSIEIHVKQRLDANVSA